MIGTGRRRDHVVVHGVHVMSRGGGVLDVALVVVDVMSGRIHKTGC